MLTSILYSLRTLRRVKLLQCVHKTSSLTRDGKYECLTGQRNEIKLECSSF
jgi:hypothetical protein